MAYSVDLDTLPAEFRNAYRQLSVKAQKKWLDERYRALTDPMYLANEVMGMDFQEVPHRWLFDKMLKKNPGTPLYDLDTVKKKRMILWSRGLFKTSSVVVECVQLILNYPSIRICFMSGSETIARRQLARIKKFFEDPPKKFAALFPECVAIQKQGGRNGYKALGNTSGFTVPNRPINCSFAEPTMCISTSRSVKAGSHYDVIFVDDLVNESNYNSQKLLEKCIEDYRAICPLLAPDGFMYVTGTRYSFGDLYQLIQELAEEEMVKLGTNPWIISVQGCWMRVCKCGHKEIEHDFDKGTKECALACGCMEFVDSGATTVLFPKFRCSDGRTEGHDAAFLQSEKLRLGDGFFACQYLCLPQAEEDQTFTDDLLGKHTFFTPDQYPSDTQAPCFVIGDLAYVGAENRDFSVLLVVRYWHGRKYVIGGSSGKWDSQQVATELFKLMHKYRPLVVWLEKMPAWESYQTVFEYFATDNKLQKLPLVWLQGSREKNAKLVRIGAIKAELQQGRLWLYGHMQDYGVITDQLKKWPKSGRYDDHADCLGWVCAAPTGAWEEGLTAQEKQTPTMSFFDRLRVSNEEEFYDSRIAGSYY